MLLFFLFVSFFYFCLLLLSSLLQLQRRVYTPWTSSWIILTTCTISGQINPLATYRTITYPSWAEVYPPNNRTSVDMITYVVLAVFADPHSVFLRQVFPSSTSSPPPSRRCGTRLMTTSRTWIAPPFRTSTRSCSFLSWSTSTPNPPSLQTHRMPRETENKTNKGHSDLPILMF